MVVIRSWSALTPFGDLGATWSALLAGATIENHAQARRAGVCRRAAGLAEAVTSEIAPDGISSAAALLVGTSKGPVEEWLTPPPSYERQLRPRSRTIWWSITGLRPYVVT